MSEKLILILKTELKILAEAAEIMSRSYAICRDIKIKDGKNGKPSFEELDHFEALTSRFARLSDLIVQKMFRLIDQLELDPPGTARDRIHRAEKRGLITSSDTFVKIRLLRNEISHEYLPEEILRIFQSVLEWSPDLLECTSQVQQYCERYLDKFRDFS